MPILNAPAATSRPLLSDEDWQIIGSQLDLTRRELDILRHVVQDKKESVIAHQLGISAHTVHTYLHRLYKKLGVSSRLEAIVLVFRNHLAQTRE